MYACICERVSECEVRTAIRCGARTEESVGEACGVRAAFQCGAPVQPACVSDGSSCAALGWQCGKAVNRCGQVFDCAAEGRTCSAFETCQSDAGGPTRCVGGVSGCALCDAVPRCAADVPTRLSGRVVTPGRTDGDTANQVGVPNAFVYIPRSGNVADLPAIIRAPAAERPIGIEVARA